MVVSTVDPRPSSLYWKLLLDGGAITPSGNYEKAVTADDSTFSPIGLSGKLPIGESHTLSLVVGQKYDNVFVNSDVYNFTVTRIPGLASLTIKDANDATVPLSPVFNAGTTAYINTYSAVTLSETIKLTSNFNGAKGVKYYLGAEIEPRTANLSNVEINLAEYTGPEADIAVIPILLVYDEGGKIPSSNEYTLYISGTNYRPQITEQPQDVACDKDAAPELFVTVTEPDDGSLTYQWRGGSTTVAIRDIPGATEAAYRPPTDWAGERFYDCVVTNTVDGVAFSTTSGTAKVTVNLSYVSPPVILRQPGTYAPHRAGFPETEYKTDYKAGEKFNSMYVRLRQPEPNVEFSFEFYHNTVNSTENADHLDVVSPRTVGSGGSGTSGSVSWVELSFEPVTGFPAGEHYIYCVITATDINNSDNKSVTTSDIVALTYSEVTLDLDGSGTEEEPYLIRGAADFAKVREAVNGGLRLSGIYFKMDNDVTLPADWEPIGLISDEGDEESLNAKAFCGNLDGGGYTLTIAEGGKPLFKYAGESVIKDLNIFGTRIEGAGLINNIFTDYGEDMDYYTGCPNSVMLDNVRLLSGSSTLKSGFMQGSGSGANTITIRNCVVESDVIIGYDKQQSGIGSFVGGSFNGQIDNSFSYAAVYGVNVVGGLAGSKGQAMGMCVIRNSAFLGDIEATGDWVGGIIGKGYDSESAPNTPPVSFINCYVEADITANDYVGGIFGGEPVLKLAINNCNLRDSIFYGTITASGTNVGGIIGYLRSVDSYQRIENNYFYETSGALNAMGVIVDVVTSLPSGSSSGLEGTVIPDGAAYLAAIGSSKTAEEFADGTVLALLNNGVYQNWVQGEKYPLLLEGAVLTDLEVSGAYKNEYYIGDELNLTGIEYTAVWSNGYRESVSPDSVIVTGYDKNTRAVQTLTAEYGAATATFKVTVLKPAPGDGGPSLSTITVYFTLKGDELHDSDTDGRVHGNTMGGLQTWIERTGYTVDLNATAADVIKKAIDEAGITWDNPSGNYIKSLTRGGVTIGEFTNGRNSGWMYTLNGEFSTNGIAEQYLDNGDNILLYYTDDYTKEDGSNILTGGDAGGGGASGGTVKETGTEKTVETETAQELPLATTVTPVADTGSNTNAIARFTDVQNHWAVESISYVVEKGLFAGTSDNTFSPDRSMTRGMLVTVLGRLYGADVGSYAVSSFSDVEAGQYYAPYIEWAKANGIVSGVGDNKFAPDAEISRQDLAALLMRYADFSQKQFPVTLQYVTFSDDAEIADYAKTAVETLYRGGIISGRPGLSPEGGNVFDPSGSATRAEVASMLQRFIEKQL
jgi:hypothetical protein